MSENIVCTVKDAHFAELVLRVIDEVSCPMLMNDGEKEAVRKGLMLLLDRQPVERERRTSDLISRQALRDAMYHKAFETDSGMQRWDSGCWVRYKMFENVIESVPSIDPVKRGKWMEQKVTHEDNRRSMIIADWQSAKCSNCGRYHTTPYTYYFYHYNYCPWCGAKMNEEEQENES